MSILSLLFIVKNLLLFIYCKESSNLFNNFEFNITRKISNEPLKESVLFRGENGGVASENAECSKIGVNIMKSGGNAVDSAISTAICMGTLNPFSSGIGGGGFLILRNYTGKVEFIDFRETAPQLSNTTMYNNNPYGSLVGGLAVAIPGEIKGFELLHAKYGKLPWKELFEPSIKLAELGFDPSFELIKRLNRNKDWIIKSYEFSKIFTINGILISISDKVYRKGYANTLKKIAEEGSKAFYEGEIAQEIVNYAIENGGILSLEDLKNYKALIREPHIGSFQNSAVISTSAPSSGSILISVLELFDSVIKSNGIGAQVDFYHKFIECLKFGFASRTRLGDPAFNLTIAQFEKEIITKEYIDKLRARIDLTKTHDYTYYKPMFDTKELLGTTHISVIDKDNSAVSLTSTINTEFGSRLMTPKFGIILNNHMNDFSIPAKSNAFNLSPSPLNFIEPNKRPLSSTVPTIIVKNDGEILCLGGSGGSLILSSVIQVILEIFINQKSYHKAIDSPRIHNQLLPQLTRVELSFNKALANELANLNHNISWWSAISEVQLVSKNSDKSVQAISDFRKNALAYAY